MKRTCLVCLLWLAAGIGTLRAAPLGWKQSPGSLALASGDTIVWQFDYGAAEGKPYFHPITIGGGPVLTDLRPADHPWHLALWFSWKFINGVNYWEQDPKTGQAAGTTEVLEVKTEPRPDHSAQLQMKLAYHPPGQPPLLSETRSIRVGAPDASGGWRMDWDGVFTADADHVSLDRTPIAGEPEGVSWGGYAGLSFRLTPLLRSGQFTGAEGAVSGTSTRSRWIAFGGALPEGRTATILVLDHPRSFRHPTSWYLIKDMPYFSPAVLYHSPHVLRQGQSIRLKYRILFLPSAIDAQAADQQWQQFAGEDAAK